MQTKLSTYNNDWYQPPGNRITRALWYVCNAIVFNTAFFPFNNLKILLLKCFGAQIETGVVIKPKVNIKYPKNLTIGAHSWIGEGVWIDNLSKVHIGKNCCLSQGAMLLCGNHNYKQHSFDLITKPIHLEDGVWIAAKSMVGPGVTCKSHAILSAYSFTSKDLDSYSIYAGNPAKKIKERGID